MKPKGSNSWWVAALLLALLAGGLAIVSFDVAGPSGWVVIALAIAAIACAALAMRTPRKQV